MIYYSEQTLVGIDDKDSVNLVFVHYFLNLTDFGCGSDGFGIACHNVIDCLVEELLLPLFHSPSYVAVGDNASHFAVVQRHAKSQFALAHKDYGLAKMHVLGQDRHIFGAHHITCSGEKTLAKRATGMELRKILGFEVAHFHQ